MNCLVVLNHLDSTGPKLGRKHLLRPGRPEPLPLTGWDIRQILGGPMGTTETGDFRVHQGKILDGERAPHGLA